MPIFLNFCVLTSVDLLQFQVNNITSAKIIYELIMVYKCNICKKEFRSRSFEDLNGFCKHVGGCPIRSDNILADRFCCNACGNVVQKNQSYKNHLIKCQPPSIGHASVNSSVPDKSSKMLSE